MSSANVIANWIQAQKLRGPEMKKDAASVFYRNLEQELDVRRTDQNLLNTRTRPPTAVDFSSNDVLSMSTTGLLREAFLQELALHPDFKVGASGSRVLDGNTEYIETVEREIADFHKAESAILVNSGYEGNGAIFAVIPRAGDVIVYDELMHASVHDGMKDCQARTRLAFRHNDVDALYDTLVSVQESQPQIAQGKRTVLVAIETVYSMDGDICPLREMIQSALEAIPLGNIQFLVDEAHSTGVLGPKGAGIVADLGLEKHPNIAIRMHTFGKAMGSTGAVILANDTIRSMLINYSRSIIYTTAPSFPMLASMRAAYSLLQTGATQVAQDKIQRLVKLFCRLITSHPAWGKANEHNILRIPVIDDWETKEKMTHIVPLWTQKRHNFFLSFHLQLANFSAFPVDAPVVPIGSSRVRLVFHSVNTEEQVEALTKCMGEWAQEMVDIQESGKAGTKLPSAAYQAYATAASQVQAN